MPVDRIFIYLRKSKYGPYSLLPTTRNKNTNRWDLNEDRKSLW